MMGLSGELDLSTVAYLGIKALGKDKVCDLILPKRDSDPHNTNYAMNLAKSLSIPHEKISISPILRELGVYDLMSHEKASDREVMEQNAIQ